MTGMPLQKVKSLKNQVYQFIQQGYGKVTKMTRFHHKMRRIKTINLTQKYFVSC